MVPLHAQSAEKTSFGQFELTIQTAELFKNGRKVRLSGQSAQLLVFLVQRPGQLVSREDLRRKLWPRDTYVDFDRGLNNCISRIREALGDSFAIPQYIETLPKQGYRFIAETHASGLITTVPEEAIPERHAEPVSVRADVAPTALETPVRRRWRSIALAGSILLASMGAVWELWERDYFWHNPLDGAKVERLTDFGGDELDAAISGDGKLAIFSSERSGQPNVWLTEIGSGEFANTTNGAVPRLIFGNGAVRRIGFSGDGLQVWATEQASHSPIKEKTWIGPEIGGVFHPFLEDGLEPAWSPDGRRIVYHTADAGDPIFIADWNGNNPRRVFGQKPGIHSHFLTWSTDGRYIYFVAGTPTTEEMDIWRIPAFGTSHPSIPERITHLNSRVAYLAWLNSRTLIYSATAEDGSGQWLYSMDVEHRIPHRVSSGIEDQYLSVSVNKVLPHRLVTTVAHPSASVWTVPVSERIQPETSVAQLQVPNARALGPRLGSGYLLFLSARGGGDGLWRFENGTARELWKGSAGGLVAPPAIANNGQICFSYRKDGHAHLNIMSANGTNVQPLAASLDVRGGASWSPDGKWIAVAADDGGGTHVFKIPVDGGEPIRLVDTLSYNPVWSPDGNMIVYSEQQGGSRFVLKAVTPEKAPMSIPDISVIYTIATSYGFLPLQNALIVLGGDFRKQNFYRVDLSTGEERRLTDLQPGFQVQNFDVSSDGKQIVFDRMRDNADVVVMDLIK
jgi:Tol biopolymer transport system component/DNA-binding winged helix-turn-helix (wHTH) protein